MDTNYYHEKLEQLLGYSFNEKDLSPSTRRMMSEYKHYAEEMYEIEQTFMKKKVGKVPEEEVANKTYSFMNIKSLVPLIIEEIILGILCYLLLTEIYMYLLEYSDLLSEISFYLGIGILIAVVLTPIIAYKNTRANRNTIHRYYDLKRKFSPLIEAIHKDLSEVYRLKLRPETIEYKIIADFSFKEGTLSIKCPNCKANIDISKDKIEGNKYKCPYCQTTIILPEKLLDLL